MKPFCRYRRAFLALAFLVMALASCKEEGIPTEVLPFETMVPVMKELEIAYAGVDQTEKDPRNRVKKYEEMNSLVLKKNNLEKQQFFTSYQWYEAHPVLLDSIFKEVVRSLNDELLNLDAK